MALSRKEKERLVKRELILSEAESVFADKGFTSATLDEIGERAEFSKAALYLYFKNKEDIISSLFSSRFGEMIDLIKKDIENDSAVEDKLKSLVKVHNLFHRQHPKFFKLISRLKAELGSESDDFQRLINNLLPTLYANYYQLIRAIFAEGIKNNFFVNQSPDLLTHFFLGSVLELEYYFQTVEGELNTENEYLNLLDIFLNGIKFNQK